MTVYVDPLTIYPNAWGPFLGGSCHLVADDREELHAFAKRLGMKRSWFQTDHRLPHYDLTASKRAKAVKLGVKEITFRELVEFMRGHEAQRSQGELFAASRTIR